MLLNFLLQKDHSVDDFITLWGKDFPLLLKLKSTIQDDEWHAEGDVHIHTDMVLSEVYKINRDVENNLSDKEKITLILSALFHDICKPFTTKEKELHGKMRIVSPRHEEHGKNYLFYTLNKIVKDYEMFNNIINIVGYHQLPKLLVIKNDPLRKFYQLARKVPLKLIYLLEIADMKGRTCQDKDGQLEYLELFKMYAEDENIWEVAEMYKSQKDFIYSELKDFPELTKQYVFAEFCRQFEKGNITCPEEEIARSYQYRDSYAHLVLNCGISGIGKSTYLEKNYEGYNVISLDNIREELLGSRSNHTQERKILTEAKSRLKVMLAKKEKIVWDATNYRFDFRKVPLELGFNYGAFNEVILFNDTKENVMKQNKKRSHDIPEIAIDTQIKKFEVPNIEECHNIKEVYRF
jgi:predicted kinase